MRVVRGNGGTLVYVPMRVNGHGPYEFVLDTGSSNSSVDRSLVRRWACRAPGGSIRSRASTGSGVVPMVKVHRWTLGGLPMHGTSLSVVDLGIGVGGLLGSDELCRFGNVVLDFRHNKLDRHPASLTVEYQSARAAAPRVTESRSSSRRPGAGSPP